MVSSVQNNEVTNMTVDIKLEQIYAISEDVVVREIDDEIIIIPIVSGIGDMEDELYSMNPTGKAILQKIDGERTLTQIAQDLSETYDASMDDIKQDVLGVVGELVKRRMLVMLPWFTNKTSENKVQTPKENIMPNRQFAILMQDVIKKGKAFRFQASGFSMAPFIKDGDILTLVGIKDQDVGKGDILAFHNPFHGKLTVHRVVTCKNNQLLMKPDNGETLDGWINFENVIGIVRSIERNGNPVKFGLGWEKRLIARLSRKNRLTPTIGSFWQFFPSSIKRKIKGD